MKLLENHTGKSANDLDAITILCHRGTRCMGAFSYQPATESGTQATLSEAELDLYCKKAATLNNKPLDIEDTILAALEDSGGSAGGMRPKILLALPTDRTKKNAFKSLPGFDHSDMPEGYEPWILKFDTEPAQERGKIEHAYARLAKSCGLDVPRTRVIPTKGEDGIERAHFAIQRFDRAKVGDDWHRIHMHSAAGLLRRNFNALDLDYTDLLELTKTLTGSPSQVKQCFRRAVFNTLAGNADDHAKNHAFLMNSSGKWSLAPAYDITPSRLRQSPGIRSTSVLGNKTEIIPRKTFVDLGQRHGISTTETKAIIQEIEEGLARWTKLAGEAGISAAGASRIQTRLSSLQFPRTKPGYLG